MPRFQVAKVARCLSLPAIGLLMAGCGSAGHVVLTADDVISLPNGKAIFAASVFKDYGSSLHSDVTGTNVTFLVNDRPVTHGLTNEDGRLVVEGDIHSNAQTFKARTVVNGQLLQASGSVYRWSPRKTIIAVDIDETISATSYSDLFIAVNDGSKPIKGAADALWSMSKDYQILYISARPQFLQEKTRAWLRANRFPPAPYMGADRFEACLHQEAYKRRILEGVKARWPNLLIGIGDKKVDDGAYGANDMLTFIVNPWPIGSYTQRCVMMRDWQGISRFFETHGERLSDPTLLAGLIRDNGEQLRPAFARLASAPRTKTIVQTSLAADSLVRDGKPAIQTQTENQASGLAFSAQ